MTRLGADPDALRDLGSTLRRCASELDRIAVGLDGRVRVAGWRGPDAVRFEQDWTGVQRVRLASGARRCSELATALERQAVSKAKGNAAYSTKTRAEIGTMTAARHFRERRRGKSHERPNATRTAWDNDTKTAMRVGVRRW